MAKKKEKNQGVPVFSLGATRMNTIKNEQGKRNARRLKWIVNTLVEGCWTWTSQVGGKRRRPKRRFQDVVNEDTQLVDATTEEDREEFQRSGHGPDINLVEML